MRLAVTWGTPNPGAGLRPLLPIAATITMIAKALGTVQRLPALLTNLSPLPAMREPLSPPHFTMRKLRYRGECLAQSHPPEPGLGWDLNADSLTPRSVCQIWTPDLPVL